MKFVYGLAATFMLVTACTHMPPKGIVAMKVTDNIAHVAMKDVTPGEMVSLQTEICPPQIGGPSEGGAEGAVVCRTKEVAQGVVSRIINNEYVEVEFPSDVILTEGQSVSVIR